MSDIAIKVEGLSKVYLVGHNTANAERYTTLREIIARNARDLARKTRDMVHGRAIIQGDEVEEFWALTDVSLDIRQGEALGIIGHNGAGKSTLLKIISRITSPTRGRIVVRGRVASLLEVGTGFHPELSGRENIYLNGAILGMSRHEIRCKFTDIVDFAEVGSFLDTPVKRYSSGMYVRLAFSVAAHLEPEILLVDEVLAVGDASFQKKCLGTMGDVTSQGRTIIFVSHNMTAVQSLCRRCIALSKGSVSDDGTASEVVAAYLSRATGEIGARRWQSIDAAPGNDIVRFASIEAVPSFDNGPSVITINSAFRLRVEFWCLQPERNFHITLHLFDQQGVLVLTTFPVSRGYDVGKHRLECNFPAPFLNSGTYFVTGLLVEDSSRITFKQDAMLSFQVVEAERKGVGYLGREPGILVPQLPWHHVVIERGL